MAIVKLWPAVEEEGVIAAGPELTTLSRADASRTVE
jgi:hypothetical protein